MVPTGVQNSRVSLDPIGDFWWSQLVSKIPGFHWTRSETFDGPNLRPKFPGFMTKIDSNTTRNPSFLLTFLIVSRDPVNPPPPRLPRALTLMGKIRMLLRQNLCDIRAYDMLMKIMDF